LDARQLMVEWKVGGMHGVGETMEWRGGWTISGGVGVRGRTLYRRRWRTVFLSVGKTRKWKIVKQLKKRPALRKSRWKKLQM